MKRNVLVVDDDELTIEILTMILDLEEFEVSVARDGLAALERVAERRPDVIVLDMRMPGLDGLEVCRRLKSDPVTAEVPVIALTGQDGEDDRRDALAAGCDLFVTKPFSPLGLIDTIREFAATGTRSRG